MIVWGIKVKNIKGRGDYQIVIAPPVFATFYRSKRNFSMASTSLAVNGKSTVYVNPVIFPCKETLYPAIEAVVPLILVRYAFRLSSDCANNLCHPC